MLIAFMSKKNEISILDSAKHPMAIILTYGDKQSIQAFIKNCGHLLPCSPDNIPQKKIDQFTRRAKIELEKYMKGA